jgi:hypothetical protein
VSLHRRQHDPVLIKRQVEIVTRLDAYSLIGLFGIPFGVYKENLPQEESAR